MKRDIIFLSLFLAVIITIIMLTDEQQEDTLINRSALEWENKVWINSEPLSFSSLKGNVILIRW
tara:strand:+ start:164 stop:355 length:192 start_codon:yes stop_codon:yes gene_type:complete